MHLSQVGTQTFVLREGQAGGLKCLRVMVMSSTPTPSPSCSWTNCRLCRCYITPVRQNRSFCNRSMGGSWRSGRGCRLTCNSAWKKCS